MVLDRENLPLWQEIEIDDQLEDDDLPQRIRYSITSYGVDYPVDSLVKRLEAGDIIVPKFQRQYVWKLTQASRFIESLMLGLPVPGIFLSKEIDTRKLLVIDGQQRLLTLHYFYTGIFADTGREFALRGVQNEFKNLTYKRMRDEDRRKLDDSIIHATIVQQEEPGNDNSSVYHIFERLNTGGTLLTPQEIRACVNHGSFNELLSQLNQNSSWRSVFGQESARMRDRELILRFLALFDMSQEYEPTMNDFLNTYMSKKSNLDQQEADRLGNIFNSSIDTLFQCLGKSAFRPKKGLNAAVFDSVMIGMAKRLERGDVTEQSKVKHSYQALISDPDYLSVIDKGTAREDAVQTRIRMAIRAFENV